MQATIVYEQIWDAMNAVDENGKKLYKYIVLEGSSRSSKTRSLLQAYYNYAYENTRARLSVWRDTKKDCKDTVLHDMNKVYPDLKRYDEVGFNKTDSIFLFPTKCTIEICGTDEPNKVHGFQGDVTWLNEPYNISRATFDQLDMRTTDIVFIDWNPKQSHWVDDVKKDPRCKVLHNTFRDNPFCPEEQRIKILSYQPIKAAAAVELGLISEDNVRAYDFANNPLQLTQRQINELLRCISNETKNSANLFNWQVYGLGLKSEKPNRIFKWTKIPDHEYHSLNVEKYNGVDWGAVDPMGVLEAKYYDGGLYLHEKNYRSENEIRTSLTPAQLMEINKIDEGLIMWYFNKLGLKKEVVTVCDSNRPLKILALRSAGFDYAIAAVKGAGSIIDGIDLLNSLRVYYTESSTNIEMEQENYSRKEDRYGVVLEEPEDLFNHLIDPARYIAEFLRQQGIIKNI